MFKKIVLSQNKMVGAIVKPFTYNHGDDKGPTSWSLLALGSHSLFMIENQRLCLFAFVF